MIRAIPLTALPLVAFNLVGYSLSGADPWAQELVGLTLPSGTRWSMQLGDLLVLFAIATLFLDVVRAARPAGRSAIQHALAIVVLTVYVVEFVAAGVAAHSVFVVLTALALFDVLAGFVISISRSKHSAAVAREIDEDQ